jgi:hypothetical protein
MRRGLITSSLLHIAVAIALYVGLPNFGRPLRVEQAITVEIVSLPQVTQEKPTAPEPAASAPLPERQATSRAPEPEQPAPIEPEPAPAPPEETEPDPAPEAVPAPEPEPEPEPVPPPPRPAAKPTPPPPPPRPATKPERPEPAPVAEAETSTPEPEADDDSLNALLRSVENLDRRVRDDVTRDGIGTADPRRSDAQPPSNFGGATLSMREIGSIKQQIERCWNVPVGVRGIETMIVKLRIRMSPDGRVSSVATEDRIRTLSDPSFRAVAESAERAVRQCSPLRLPPEKFQAWRDMIVTFHPKDALSG